MSIKGEGDTEDASYLPYFCLEKMSTSLAEPDA